MSPILKTNRETKTVALPSYPESKVEIYKDIIFGDLVGFNLGEGGELDVNKSLDFLPKLIKSWNFTNEKNEALIVNSENLKLLNVADVTFLFEQVTDLFKKKEQSGK